VQTDGQTVPCIDGREMILVTLQQFQAELLGIEAH